MSNQKSKTIYLNAYRKDAVLWQRDEKENRYRCAMAGNRLDGVCEVLIYDRYQNCAELFLLYFSPDGLKAHRYLEREEADLWLMRREKQIIPYPCALRLLKDAVRQNYKYQTPAAWLQNYESLHARQIWQKQLEDETRNLDLFLQQLNPEQFIEVYLNAIGNKDAVLLYDMQAAVKKHHVSRELYAHSWNHVLEELTITDFSMTCVAQNLDGKSWDIYLTVYGGYQDAEPLSVDLCLKLIRENGYMRLLYEHVLDACHISGC